MRILISGGAGFVGSSLAKLYRADFPEAEIVALDNLKRRGSEINLELFKKLNVSFVHGDIRVAADLNDLPGNFDLFVEASAEPSVMAGLSSSPSYVLQTNLVGTLNCLEFTRSRADKMIFLSTSRVYSMEPLKKIKFNEAPTRFEIADDQSIPGLSRRGISEDFPTNSARSLYGATKLASELIIQEYAELYQTKVLINRCGVICGLGQFGKVDQGVFTLWVAQHYFNRPLKYTGFGGSGKQVRDLLHPLDLYALLKKQTEKSEHFNGEIFNVGGGREISVSMKEMTVLCQEATGQKVEVVEDKSTTKVDVPLYLSDFAKAEKTFFWKPTRTPQFMVKEIAEWIKANEAKLRPIFL